MIRLMHNQWYECKIRYTRLGRKGRTKYLMATYIVNGSSFGDAERHAMDIGEELSKGNSLYSVHAICHAPYSAVFFDTDRGYDSHWYKVKLITIERLSVDKDKRVAVNYLVSAHTTSEAADVVKGYFDMHIPMDIEIASVIETSVADVRNFE